MQANNQLYRENAWQALSLQQHGKAMLTPSFSSGAISLGLIIWVVAIAYLLTQHSFVEKATVTGYVSNSQASISVSPKESIGVISALYVKNGEYVEQGQALLTIERPHGLLSGEQSLAQQHALLQQQATLIKSNHKQRISDYRQQKTFVIQQLDSARAHQQAISEQVSYLKERLALAKQEQNKLESLFNKQLISITSLNTSKQNVLSMQQQLAQFTQQLSDSRISQTRLTAQHAELEQKISQQITQNELQLIPLEQQINELSTQQSYTIFATRAGIINNLYAQSGDDVSRHSVLMKLSDPSQSLKLMLAIPSTAIGFVETKQNVRVRLDAFPHQKYGTLEAQVTKVANAITLPNESHAHAIALQEPVFMVQAALEKPYIIAKGEPVFVKEGMIVQADVMLSERSLLEWLLSPLYSLKGSL